jgi:tetratricopeptide (TPR) repeat protein
MTTCRDVFAKRKEGQLDEAYQMAVQRMGAPDKDEWDDKAFGWCLIDLIKRDVKAGMHDNLGHYRQQLEAIEVSASDDVLTKQRQFAISLCNPNGQLVNEARQLSKSGRHEEAADIYRKLLANPPSDIDICTSLGWELYRISKALLDREPVNILAFKKNLNEYLKLNVEKPSLLHTCILQVASKFAGAERFSMVAFSRLWGLEYLRPEDWERFVTDDRKELPSLAEKVIQQASKEVSKGNDQGLLSYILQYLDKAIAEYPDNIWLSLNKAKVLLGLGRNDDALKFAIEVTRAKPNDYWTWELLGDITTTSGSDLSLSCYCKALLYSSDDRFSGKVRLKLATLLVERGQLPEAKYEINRVLVAKEKEGNKIPDQVEGFVSQAWYAKASLSQSNEDFYRSHKAAAEDLLFRQLPWIAANIGEVFTIPGKENKPKRKLYLKIDSDPIEVVIPDGKFAIPDGVVGNAIRVKGEWDAQNRFQIYMVSQRIADGLWDVFTEHVGVVDHVNHQKKLIHYIVDRKTDGVIPFSDLESTFKAGDAIAVKLAIYTTKQGCRHRTLAATRTDIEPPQSLKKTFHEKVNVLDQLCFTTSDIFIPPPLLQGGGVQDGNVVSGVALLNYDKKRGEWGWKAITIEEVSANDLD